MTTIGSGGNRGQTTADGGGSNRQTTVAAAQWTAVRLMDGGGGGGGQRRQRTGGGIYEICRIVCNKGEEDIWVSFPRIPMYVYTSSACHVCVRSQEFNSWGKQPGQRGKRMKNTDRNDATSSNLKGKPMTKTIDLHCSRVAFNRLQNTFPPQMK